MCRLPTIVGFVLVIIISIVIVPLYNFGLFRRIQPIPGRECKLITADNLLGAEDIAADHSQKALIIAAHNRSTFHSVISHGWNEYLKDKPPGGNIFILRYETDQVSIMKMNNFPTEANFYPHGISLIPQYNKDTENANARLFVVNHRSDKDYIEVFDIDYADNSVNYVTSVSHPTIVNANDVAAFDDGDTFLVTNMLSRPLGTPDRLRIVAELSGILTGGSLVLCKVSSQQCNVLVDDLYISNGVLLSQDQNSIFLVVSKRILQFTFHSSNNTVSLLNQYPVSSECDNLSFDKDGTLYTACHPQPYRFTLHGTNNRIPAPSQVTILKPSHSTSFSGNEKTEDIFLSDGTDFSASSVAVPDNLGNMYIGGVFAAGVFKCKT